MLDAILAYVAANPIEVAALVVALASIVCAGTPTPPPDTWLGRLYRALEYLALNVGRAKDRPAPRCGGDEGTGSGDPRRQRPPGGATAALLLALLLAGCGFTAEGDRLRDLAEQTAVRVSDQTLENVIFYQCELARIGALRRAFGRSAETASAYHTLCGSSAATGLLGPPAEP